MTTFPDDLSISWNYFESHHGKGPVVISIPEQFATFANQQIDGIKVQFVSEDDILLK